MTMSTRLYLVKLRGLYSSNVHESYVVANDPTNAYLAVRVWLDKQDYGFPKDRVLESVTLVADDDQYANVPHRLFLQE